MSNQVWACTCCIWNNFCESNGTDRSLMISTREIGLSWHDRVNRPFACKLLSVSNKGCFYSHSCAPFHKPVLISLKRPSTQWNPITMCLDPLTIDHATAHTNFHPIMKFFLYMSVHFGARIVSLKTFALFPCILLISFNQSIKRLWLRLWLTLKFETVSRSVTTNKF